MGLPCKGLFETSMNLASTTKGHCCLETCSCREFRAKATLRFGNLQQPNLEIVTFDLSTLCRHTGPELSGFLGFAMLRQLELELDRDGLVDLDYDPKRVQPFAR